MIIVPNILTGFCSVRVAPTTNPKVKVLETVPKSRPQLVNELEVPDVSVSPYEWQPEASPASSDSLPSLSAASSDSSLALSRAMTDSDIDYDRYRRLKSRSFSDPWLQMRAALDAFPPGYLDSLNSFEDTSPEPTSAETSASYHERYSEELRMKMERFFDEDCRVFSPEDPGLLALEEALQDLDLKDSDLDSTN